MSADVEFWKTEGINYLRWYDNTPEYYEGAQNVATVVDFVGGKPVRDVGCGYGRLARNFDPSRYVGYDIGEHVVKKAQRMNPSFTFKHWQFESLDSAPVTMFINGPHLVNDEEIESIIALLCENTQEVIFAEIMDRQYRSIPYPYGVYHRDVNEYDALLAVHGFKRDRLVVSEHERLKFPYHIGKWQR